MVLPKEVQEWIDSDKSKPLIITMAHVQGWRSNEMDNFNWWLKKEVLDKPSVYEHKWEGTIQLRTITYIAAGHVFSGTPDARQSTDSPAPDAGPFRRRYRALTPDEVKHHDDIKDAATELWNLIESIPSVRGDISTSDRLPLDEATFKLNGEVRRDMALAKTALEDAVMRAVRALTA